MNAKSFIDSLSLSDTIEGDFDFISEMSALMDMDIENKKFVNCKIVGGDFASGIFKSCSFDKVLFRKTNLVGVGFDNCHFIDCKFSNIDCDFSMNNCKIEHLVLTRESDGIARV